MSKIIHNPKELMNLDRDTLDELLLSEYKNSALLRELIRISLFQLKEQTELVEFYKHNKDKELNRLNNIKQDMDRLIEKYIWE